MASTSLHKALLLLSHSTSRADVFAKHLHRLISTTNGFDSLLRTLQYALVLLHSQLTRVLTNRYEKLALSIASKAESQMMPGETLVATIEAPHMTLTEYCVRTKAASDALEDVRLFIRLHGLLNLYNSAKEIYTEGKRDPAIKLLTWSRIYALAGYQVLENGAYLIRRGTISDQKWQDRETKLWVWSSRFWLAAVVLDLLKLMRVRQLRYNEDWGAELKLQEESRVTTQSEELKKRWWRSLYTALGWVPYALHFSYHDEEQSPVSEAWLGASTLIPAFYSLQDAWRVAV